jgi:CubicO group peptidase (beta-lactamase class C family)
MNIQNLLQEYLEDNGTPGAAIGLIDHGKVQFFCSGNMSLDAKPITQETIFEIGSITKVFTTLLLMDIVNKGTVQLDDPIEKYLPNAKVPELEGKKITLRHLATHTSGLPRWPENCWKPKNPANPYADLTVDDIYECLLGCSLRAAPGVQFEYSNLGMGLLGFILSTQAKKSYEELIREVVAKPLDMKALCVSITQEARKQFASGHHLQQVVSCWDFTPSVVGCGGLRANIQDMTKFLAANIGSTHSSLGSAMHACHEKQFSPTSGFAVGFGWMISNSNQAEIIWHSGGTGGFRNYLGFNPKTQRGVVILSNSTEDWTDELGLLILDPDYKRPVVDRGLANNPDYLNKFVGSYEAILSEELPKQQLQIGVFGKMLTSALSQGQVGILYPESHAVFGVKGFPDGKVYFSFDDSGNISTVEARLVSTQTTLWKATPIRQ